jgi:hypothetical protein
MAPETGVLKKWSAGVINPLVLQHAMSPFTRPKIIRSQEIHYFGENLNGVGVRL